VRVAPQSPSIGRRFEERVEWAATGHRDQARCSAAGAYFVHGRA
jgi:hypothetical protein